MKCRVCGREIGDEEQFCKYCGSEQKRKRKRLTWGERKRKNEAETKEFIAKASLQAEEVKEAAEESSASVRAVLVDGAEKHYRKTVALTALFALLTVAAFAALVLIRFAEMNDTLTVVIAFALLIVAAYCAASFAERLYAARSLSEFEGRQVLVCNADRGHIAVLSSEGLFALVTGETVGGDAAAPIGESRGNDEESGEIGAETIEYGESKTEAAGTDAVAASQNDAAVKEEEDGE